MATFLHILHLFLAFIASLNENRWILSFYMQFFPTFSIFLRSWQSEQIKNIHIFFQQRLKIRITNPNSNNFQRINNLFFCLSQMKCKRYQKKRTFSHRSGIKNVRPKRKIFLIIFYIFQKWCSALRTILMFCLSFHLHIYLFFFFHVSMYVCVESVQVMLLLGLFSID